MMGKMLKLKHTFLLFSLLFPALIKLMGQDVHFSQFYSAQTYLCPSLAGSSGGFRATTIARDQWPGISKTYKTGLASADIYLSEYRSGFGLIMLYDNAGSASLNTLNLGLQYSYRLAINDLQLVPGVQVTLGQKSLDRSKLIFPDEVVTGTPSSGQLYLTDTKVFYPDLTTSLFLYDPRFWFGAVADHILRPNYSFLGSKMIIPFKFVSFGGVNIMKDNALRIEDQRRYALSYRIEFQDKFKQLDLGGYYFTNMLDFGVWYRGIPVFKNDNVTNHFMDNDAVILSVGVSTGALHITYSYDLQLSKLAGYGSGAHEVSISFEMNKLIGCVNCNSRRSALQFHKDRPRNMKLN